MASFWYASSVIKRAAHRDTQSEETRHLGTEHNEAEAGSCAAFQSCLGDCAAAAAEEGELLGGTQEWRSLD